MPAYRLYCLHKGKITKGDWLDAADDPEALAAARTHSPGIDCELWLGGRLIAQIPAEGEPIMGEN